MEQKLKGNWTEIEWKLRTDNESSVQGAWPRHVIIYKPRALNQSFIVLQFPFKFCSILVRFLFNFHWNSIQINWNWMEIEQDRKKQMSWPIVCSYPPISLDVPEFSSQWLFKEVAEYYKQWFPIEFQDQFASFFSKHGYYTLKIKPGLRIVMVNPNACLSYNL